MTQRWEQRENLPSTSGVQPLCVHVPRVSVHSTSVRSAFVRILNYITEKWIFFLSVSLDWSLDISLLTLS